MNVLVEHMAADLRQARLGAGRKPFHLSMRATRIAADADHQHAVGAQMQGRTYRGGLTHSPITEVFGLQTYRREQHRYRRTCQQMIDGQPGRPADASVTQPGLDSTFALVERHGLTRFITKGSDRNGPQMTPFDSLVDAAQVQPLGQQIL